jgi:hypothetical protein
LSFSLGSTFGASVRKAMSLRYSNLVLVDALILAVMFAMCAADIESEWRGKLSLCSGVGNFVDLSHCLVIVAVCRFGPSSPSSGSCGHSKEMDSVACSHKCGFASTSFFTASSDTCCFCLPLLRPTGGSSRAVCPGQGPSLLRSPRT